MKRFLIPMVLVTSLAVTGISSFSLAPMTDRAYQAYAEEGSLKEAFTSAAKEYQVPEEILLSLSYHLSRWETHRGEPSTSGGFGPMHLTDVDFVEDEKANDKSTPVSEVANVDPELHTLDQAATLLRVDPEELKKNPLQNIRGAAALLVEYAKETTGHHPHHIQDWYGAIAKYSGSDETAVATDFADVVYETIQKGMTHTNSKGETIVLTATKVEPNRETIKNLGLRNNRRSNVDCPNGVECQYIPAAYQQNSSKPGDYSNYDLANRPHFGPDIKYIIIHNTEVSYNGTINLFKNPKAFVSSQYVLRSSDGQITQMVDNKDLGWHAGNWYFNMHSIGLEHEGYAMQGATWFNERIYRASASLVKYLAQKYQIPLDRAHIIGHDEIPGLTQARQSVMHYDPGPYWDWEHYMTLLGAPITPAQENDSIVVIKPHFQTNQPIVDNGNPQQQPSNFVYLRTAPSHEADLIDDPALKGPGTRQGWDWSVRASAGSMYAVAERQGEWTAIWFGGQKAWFHNPNGKVTVAGKGSKVRPKKGVSSIPVYGAAYPEASAHPEGMTPATLSPLQYSIPAGQQYVTAEKVKSDYYYAKVFTYDPVATHQHIQGQEEYYRIHFNHRFAFVKASDVEVVE